MVMVWMMAILVNQEKFGDNVRQEGVLLEQVKYGLD